MSAPIEMRIIGSDLDTLELLSEKMEGIFHSTEGNLYVRNDLKYKKSEFTIKIDKDKAGFYGLTSAEVAKTVRLAIAGLEIGELRNASDDEIEMQVSIRQNSTNALENFDRIHVTSLGGSLVPLKSIASISLLPAPPVIRHYNKERYSQVSSFVQTGYNTDQMTDAIIGRINSEIKLPQGYRLMAAGERLSQRGIVWRYRDDYYPDDIWFVGHSNT